MSKLQFNTYGNEKQKRAFTVLFDNIHTDVGYGGGAGGGKTYLGVSWQWMMRNKYPGTTGFFGRKELKRLKQTTLASYFKFCDDYKIPQSQRGIFNAQDGEIKYPNGSKILLLDLAHQPSDPLYTRFGSLELTDGFIDESNEVDEQCITIISTRIGRQKNEDYGLLPKLLQTFNPDKGHVYRKFYKANQDGTIEDYRCFIPALATDNKKIPRSYIEQLMKADEVTKQRLLYGNFNYDDTPGRLFDYDKILESFKPKSPFNNKRYISCDAARKGKDKAVIFVWEGYSIIDYTIFDACKTTEITQEIRYYQNKYGVSNQMTIVDEDGVGGGCVDELSCIGFVNNSLPISPYGAKNSDFLKRNFANLKTQCYFELAKAVNDNVCYFDVDSDIRNKLSEELDVVIQVDMDKDSKIRIISKEDVKAKIGRSPDYSDACMFRFYFNLVFEGVEQTEELPQFKGKEYYDYGKLKTMSELMGEDELEIGDDSIF